MEGSIVRSDSPLFCSYRLVLKSRAHEKAPLSAHPSKLYKNVSAILNSSPGICKVKALGNFPLTCYLIQSTKKEHCKSVKKDTVRITLLRHGQPDFDWQKKVRGSDFRKIERAYDAADIIDAPPESSRRLVCSHRVVVSSTLPRSIQSAHALGACTIHLSSPIFREINVPFFDHTSIKLPLRLWVPILRTLWLLGYSNNTESLPRARARAQAAANQLITLAREHKSVLLVGHGVLNHYIAKELLAAHWIGPGNPGRKYWAFGTYADNRMMTKLSPFEAGLHQKAQQAAAIALTGKKSQEET
jgi:broad specificity phosphatase PhoE